MVKSIRSTRLGILSIIILKASTVLAVGGSASAAVDPPVESTKPGAPAATPPEAEAEAPLAGPKVVERTADQITATLVRHDFDGRVRRLDVDPAIAALEHLSLTAETREKINRVVAERNALIDRIVQENLGTLAAAAQSAQSGGAGVDRRRAMEGLRELMELARPFRERGRLIDEVAPFMPAEQAAEARRLVREYWRAIVRERMEIGPPDEPGKRLTFAEASANEMLLSLGQEARQAFERTIGQQARNFEDLIRRLNLTPEQESKIRALAQDSATERMTPPESGGGYREPTRRDQLRNAGRFLEIYGMLDADQRRILLEQMRAMRAYEPMEGSEQTQGDASSGMGGVMPRPRRQRGR